VIVRLGSCNIISSYVESTITAMVSSEARSRELHLLQDLLNMQDLVIAVGCDIASVRCPM
jgi:hypothetical protein